jgi:hypothetical protein
MFVDNSRNSIKIGLSGGIPCWNSYHCLCHQLINLCFNGSLPFIHSKGTELKATRKPSIVDRPSGEPEPRRAVRQS